MTQTDSGSAASAARGTEPAPAGSLSAILLNIVGAILILGLGLGGLSYFGARSEVPRDESRGQSAAVPLVLAAPVVAWNDQFELEVDGEAATWRVLNVSTEVTGRITHKAPGCRSGSFVAAGDLLFEIDSANYRLEEERLLARCSQVEEELVSTQIGIENTQKLIGLAQEDVALKQQNLERMQNLMREKALSQQDFDAAKSADVVARNALQMQLNQLRTLQQSVRIQTASLQVAQAELKAVQLDIIRCRVTAPVSGRVVADEREEGDYLNARDRLVQISDASEMEVRCSLRDEELAWVWHYSQRLNSQPPRTSEQDADVSEQTALVQDPLGQPKVPCRVVYEAGGVQTAWQGELVRYDGSGVDRGTRMYPCRVVVRNPQEREVSSVGGQAAPITPPSLISGMFVSVKIAVDAGVPLFLIPAEAIRPGQKIWVVRDGRLHILAVKMLQMTESGAIVLQEDGDLLSEDQVVISPLATHSENMQVEVQNAELTGAFSSEVQE